MFMWVQIPPGGFRLNPGGLPRPVEAVFSVALRVLVGADDSDRQQQQGSWSLIRDKLGERRLSGADKVYNNGLKPPQCSDDNLTAEDMEY